MRSISEIAVEIMNDWKKPNFGAVPYLKSMRELTTMRDKFYEDSAANIVRYFLANAGSWRGDVARRIKTELNDMLKSPSPKSENNLTPSMF